MKTFKDLEFKSKYSKEEVALMPQSSNAMGAQIEFGNGYGVSVITGYGSYSSLGSPFELAVLKDGSLCYDTDITNDVIGHLTAEEVTELMIKVQSL